MQWLAFKWLGLAVGFGAHSGFYSMLLALSVDDACDRGDIVVHLADNASHLRFLSVTCRSRGLHLKLSLPCLSTLIVHAPERLELYFDDPKTDAARLDAVSVRWKVSSTVDTFKEALCAHSRKEIVAGVRRNPSWPDLVLWRFIRTGFGEVHHIHPCTVASGACGACLQHCCPRAYPLPRP